MRGGPGLDRGPVTDRLAVPTVVSMWARRLLDPGFAVLLVIVMCIEWSLSTKTALVGEVPALLLIVASTLPVFVRHRWPLAATLAAMVGLSLVVTLVCIYQTVPATAMFCGYTFATYYDRRRTVLLGLALGAWVLTLLLALGVPLFAFDAPRNLAFVALPLFAGAAVRERRCFVDSLRERAEIAEHTREEEALRRVAAERLRIARDVHDVVAHALTAINVQAGVGARLADRDPAQAQQTLGSIRSVSGDALAELRATLGVLRDERDAGTDAPTQPAAGLRDLGELVARMQGAGLSVTFDDRTAGAGVPAPIDTTAYRIVQEALTNALRHAPDQRVVVRVAYTDADLAISVESGRVPQPRTVVRTPARGLGSGNGVRGMQERAHALGGSVHAGPRADGGWSVQARLPVGAG